MDLRLLLVTMITIAPACDQRPAIGAVDAQDASRDVGTAPADVALADTTDDVLNPVDTSADATIRVDVDAEAEDSGGSDVNTSEPCEGGRFVSWPESGLDLGSGGPPVSTQFSAGVAIADVDGDGDPDVLTTNASVPRLFLNDGAGKFVDGTIQAQLGGLQEATAIAVADIDGDGDVDIFLGRTGGAHYLLVNDGSGKFTNVAEDWLGGNDVIAAAAFADVDGDLDLDLYVATRIDEGAHHIFRNDGGSFSLGTNGPGPNVLHATNAATWLDYDGDGDPDLLIGNDLGPWYRPDSGIHAPIQFFRNDAGSFVDVAPALGLDRRVFSMSTTVGDIDNDLDLDIYIANIGFNLLFVANGGTFTEEAVARGVDVGHLPDPIPRPLADPVYASGLPNMEEYYAAYTDRSKNQYVLSSWCSIFFDADQDGWQDLWVTNGIVPTDQFPEGPGQPNYILHNRQDGTFEPTPACYRPDVRGPTRGSAVGDLDGDGDLDILFAELGGPLVAFRNDDGAGNWLIVKLEGASPNTDAIGATVTIDVEGAHQMRHIDGGQGYLSVSERIAHFGLADAATVDSIVVRWPNGSTKTLTDIATNQRIVVSE